MAPMFLIHGCLFHHASFESTFRNNFSMSIPGKVALLCEVQHFMNKELNNSAFFVKSNGKPLMDTRES